MEVSQNLLFIVPFRSPDFNPDLLEVNLPAAQLIYLILSNVVVEDNHAARFLLTLISLRNP